MAVSGIGGAASLSLQGVLDMRNQLDDLQRQLGSGIKSNSYAGLGLDRGLTVGLRSQLSAIAGYQQTVNHIGVRLDLMQTALTQFTSTAQQLKSKVLLQAKFALDGSQTQDQKSAKTTLDQLVGILNTSDGQRYLFSGRTVDKSPVESSDHILNCDGLKAGLIQLTSERRQADLGASGLGRLDIGMPTTSSVSLTEDAISPFGFKLAGATSSISGLSVSGPSGAPADLAVDLSAATPVDGDTIRYTFTLPDGTSRDLTLTATSSATSGPGQVTIGATPDDTANNLLATLTASLGTMANTELAAASAIAAGNDFFNTDASNPPQRVDGPPFDTATAMIDGTAANTVSWYLGDNATDDPRSTALARADQSVTLAYGVRSNEESLRLTVQSVAVFAAASFSASNPDAEGEYAALQKRIGAALVGTPNQQHVADIQSQLAGVQVALSSSKDRHDQTNTTLQNLLQSVQGISTEEVAVKILSLQTTMQATLQTTAMLLRTNLLQYL